MSLFRAFSLAVLFAGASGCLTERTVRDGEGRVIYQEPEVHSPFEGEKKKLQEVDRRERQLGW